jgi:hypothetical protein
MQNLLPLGNVGGMTGVVKIVPTVTASAAYAAGNAVGGKQTLAVLSPNSTGILESLIILDKSNQKAALDIFIFDADPTAATITDKTGFVFSTDDVKVIARVSVASGDYATVNSKAVAVKSGLGIALKAASGGTSLYAAVVTSGTPTFASASDLQFVWGVLQD